jgi:hypothetical protein
MRIFKAEYPKDNTDITRSVSNAKKMWLSEIDARTIFRHTDPEQASYLNFQKRIREWKMTKEDNIFYSTLNSTLEKLPTHKWNVYRWIWSPKVKELLNKLKKWDVFEDNWFLSTSKLETEAEYFQWWNKVMMVIDSKTGRDIHKLSASPDESEILFKPWTKFKFNLKTTQGYDNVKTTYYFEEI